MFHSPTGYDSHHEKQEIGKFNQNINVIEKYVSRMSRKIYGFFFFLWILVWEIQLKTYQKINLSVCLKNLIKTVRVSREKEYIQINMWIGSKALME